VYRRQLSLVLGEFILERLCASTNLLRSHHSKNLTLSLLLNPHNESKTAEVNLSSLVPDSIESYELLIVSNFVNRALSGTFVVGVVTIDLLAKRVQECDSIHVVDTSSSLHGLDWSVCIKFDGFLVELADPSCVE